MPQHISFSHMFFLLFDKAEYGNPIWLRANLYCKIQIPSAICGQGARFIQGHTMFSEGTSSFFRLKC